MVVTLKCTECHLTSSDYQKRDDVVWNSVPYKISKYTRPLIKYNTFFYVLECIVSSIHLPIDGINKESISKGELWRGKENIRSDSKLFMQNEILYYKEIFRLKYLIHVRHDFLCSIQYTTLRPSVFGKTRTKIIYNQRN